MSSLKRRGPLAVVGCALAACAVWDVGPVRADPAPAYEILLERIGRNAPAQVEADALLEAAEARLRQAGVRANPELALRADGVLGGKPYAGWGEAEISLDLTQNLELGGRRGARVDVARAEVGVSALRREQAGIDTVARLALTYAEAEAAERRFTLAEDALTLAVADARAALVLVEEGREPLLRGIQAETEAAMARAAVEDARAERDVAFARLTAEAMLPTPVTSVEAGVLDRTSPAAPDAAASLAVRVAEAEAEAAERRIGRERAEARPNVSASLGVTRYQAEDATALTVGLSMPLPLFDRNRGNIDAARAEHRAAEARVAGARLADAADRSAALARLRASASRVAAGDMGVASAEEAYRLSRLGFEAGRISQLELRSTRVALISARDAAVEARLARVRAEIELARLQGRAPFEGGR
ncbi:TolC family protein [Brevundimonas bullata]|uniref:TolC family protein n=1 Tax=Brevundimonas bullata TaxID=13160 RepID=UPI000E0B327D|nr:TolC family protein [Brevundimonas bullata]WQE37361.1 TolC family protein [Brevundimonas bullata]